MSKRRRPWSSSGQLGNTSADSFPSTAQECFSKILEDEQFCDITFLLGPSKEQVKAHQSFLMARSAMLRANLSDEWGAKDSIIELPQFDPPAFKSFLKVSLIITLSSWRRNPDSMLAINFFYDQQDMMDEIGEFMAK